MRVHNRSGPALGAGGLCGVIAVVFAQCSPATDGASTTTQPVSIPITAPAWSGPAVSTTPSTAPATSVPEPTLPATSVAVLPPTVPPLPTTAAPTAPAPTAPATPPISVATAPPPIPPTAPPTTVTTTTPTTTTTAPTTTTTPTTTTPSTGVSDAVDLTNVQRAAAGLAPLGENAALVDAARSHSIDQASRQQMTHVGSDGSRAGERIARAGFTAVAWGENVAVGYDSATAVIEAWMRSATHRDNILSGDYTVIGVASAQAGDGTPYWTMVLAA
jgi:uncharacterized protein YkwD